MICKIIQFLQLQWIYQWLIIYVSPQQRDTKLSRSYKLSKLVPESLKVEHSHPLVRRPALSTRAPALPAVQTTCNRILIIDTPSSREARHCPAYGVYTLFLWPTQILTQTDKQTTMPHMNIWVVSDTLAHVVGLILASDKKSPRFVGFLFLFVFVPDMFG